MPADNCMEKKGWLQFHGKIPAAESDNTHFPLLLNLFSFSLHPFFQEQDEMERQSRILSVRNRYTASLFLHLKRDTGFLPL